MLIDGPPVDTVFIPSASRPPKRFEFRFRGAPQASYIDIPLVQRFLTAYSNLGYWVSAGDDSTYSVTLHRREGGPLRIESDLPPVQVSAAERQFHFKLFGETVKAREAGGPPGIDLIPTRKPHVSQITTDADGRIWVKLPQPAVREAIDTLADPASSGTRVTYSSGGAVFESVRESPGPRATERWVEPVVYDVFAATGDYIGRLNLPDRATFGNARGDKIWLVLKNELDVQTLVRFRFAVGASR
jgi:hypothetical protein